MRVVVVGAGPAGAALSHVMARNEIDVTLLERQTDFAREFRGEGLQGSGARAIAQLGLGAELAALPQTSPNRFEIYIGERRAVSVELGPLLGDAGVHFVSQPVGHGQTGSIGKEHGVLLKTERD